MTGWDAGPLAEAAALVVAGGAVVVLVCLGIAVRSWHPTVSVFLDLLLAAALLRLGATDAWPSIAAAAGLVAVRAAWSLRHGPERPRRHAG